MDKNILVVGCGGIGCEVLKLLILKKIKKLTIIDMDIIEISNLNRQFFFKEKDIGFSKVDVSRCIYEKMVDNSEITALNCNIMTEKFDIDFFQQFDVVLNCLDNVKTRSYINLRCRISNVPLIDGGSAGFFGQSMIFFKNECYDCEPKIEQKIHPICTIKGIPTEFDHCVAYAKDVIFIKLQKYRNKFASKKQIINFFKKNKISSENMKYIRKIRKLFNKLKESNFPNFNKDNQVIVKFIYYISCLRANQFKINAISYFEAEKIIKNIIPSVCTTNAIIASLMVNSLNDLKRISLKKNFFLTKAKKLITSQEISQKNFNCDICNSNWFILNLIDSHLNIQYLLNQMGFEIANVIYKDMLIDTKSFKEPLLVEHNTVIIVNSNVEIFKFYIQTYREFFKIQEIENN